MARVQKRKRIITGHCLPVAEGEPLGEKDAKDQVLHQEPG